MSVSYTHLEKQMEDYELKPAPGNPPLSCLMVFMVSLLAGFLRGFLPSGFIFEPGSNGSVSYTHLDVYKRQHRKNHGHIVFDDLVCKIGEIPNGTIIRHRGKQGQQDG